MERRRFLAATAASAAAALAPMAASAAPTTAVGVGSASYHLRGGADRRNQSESPLLDTLNFLNHCRELGAGGIQSRLSSFDNGYVKRVRKLAEASGMWFEVSLRMPRAAAELDEFKDQVRACRNAGVKVIRTVLSRGRRYEDVHSREAFEDLSESAWKTITLAEPTLRKNGMRAAIENHKDWRAPEFETLLERLSSDYVGVTLDFGNNLSLLEDPIDTVEALAPYAFSCHLKDHALREYEDGFLLLDAPLGEGFMDLPRMVSTLHQHKPSIRFTLETMTRDALEIPYLKPKYWETFTDEDLPGRDVAKTLALVKKTQPKDPFPLVSDLSPEVQLKLEDDNVRKGLAYARDVLNL